MCQHCATRNIRTVYKKQASIHLKIDISFIFIVCKQQTLTLYMRNDEFSHAWMIKSCIYCNLPSFEEGFPIISSFDNRNDFCKNCIGGFGLFVAISICVEVILGMNLQFSVISVCMHFFTFYMRIYTYFSVQSVSIGVFHTRYKSMSIPRPDKHKTTN